VTLVDTKIRPFLPRRKTKSTARRKSEEATVSVFPHRSGGNISHEDRCGICCG
jgi:hypothetical protein